MSTAKETIVRFGAKALLKTKQHAPTILTIAGIGLGVAATGMAIKSTMNVGTIFDRRTEDLATINLREREASEKDNLVYTKNMADADRQKVTWSTCGRMARLYFPTVVLTAGSIGCILTANHILDERLAATMTAFAALNTRFGDYRARVSDRYGEDTERDIYNGVTVVEEKNSKGKKTGETHREVEEPKADSLDKYFDQLCTREWDSNNPEMNVANLRSKLQMANDKLRAQGYLFLNDVYDMLDIPRTPQGQILGWVYSDDPCLMVDGDEPKGYVDLGIEDGSGDPYDYNNDKPWDGKLGILLHPDVDGIIYDLI